ncbi:MAG: hypothetical protein Q8P30_04595, partial [Candidatus Uhrbacteria bacterium]|nr:hypothetical protein [Candidatus Uhrbacteria bacterium]
MQEFNSHKEAHSSIPESNKEVLKDMSKIPDLRGTIDDMVDYVKNVKRPLRSLQTGKGRDSDLLQILSLMKEKRVGFSYNHNPLIESLRIILSGIGKDKPETPTLPPGGILC